LNSNVRRPLVLLAAATLIGCQAVAGIDDRTLAPPIADANDATMGIDTAEDSGTIAIDSSTLADEGEAETMTVLPDTAVDTSDASDATDAADTATPSRIVINEVKAAGGDYVEIYNRSSETIDISGWGVTGTEDTGAFSTPVRFAAGTTLAPGAWLLVLAGMGTRGGPETACGLGGPMSCYHTDWGISQSRGETLRVLRVGEAIEDEYSYPKDGHPDTLSWGRVPDGTGAFVITTPSPGAANKL
jgi:hypothetical protein